MNKSTLLFGIMLASTALSANVKAEENNSLKTINVIAPLQTPAVDSLNVDDNLNITPYSDSADSFKSLPGLSAGRFGGHGLEPVIRGQSQNQINVIDSDAYVFGGCPNRMDPPSSYLDLESADVLTIVKGYQSVLNGSGGAGGTIIVERNTPKKLDSALGYYGSADAGFDGNSQSWFSGAQATGGTDQAYVKATARIKDAENYEDGNGNVVRSSFAEKSGGFALGITPEDTHLYAGYDFKKIDDALFPGAGMDSVLAENQTFRLGFEKHYANQLLSLINVSAYGTLVDHVMDTYSLRPNPTMFARVDSQSDTFGAKLKTDFTLSDQTVHSVVEWRRNNRNSDKYMGMMASNVSNLQSVMWPDITLDEIGLGLETSFILSEQDLLVVGGRYDYVSVEYGRANDVAAASGLSANDLYRQFYGATAKDEHEHNLSGLLRLEHKLDNDTTLYSALSRSVRTADATERGLANYTMMMGNNLSWVGNPNIKPEKHHQLEAGVSVAKEEWDTNVSLYANRVSDYILRDSARGQNGILVTATNADIYRNVDALLSGVEVEGSWDIAQNWTLSADATYTYGENLDDDMVLAQIPPLQGHVNLAWLASDAITVNQGMRWATTQTRVDTDPTVGSGLDVGKTSGYAVFDFNTIVKHTEDARFIIGVNNLFDQTYANHLNRSNISDPTQIQVNEPGRSFYAQLKITF